MKSKIFLLLLFFATNLYSQTGLLTGKIIDASTKEILIGANVLVTELNNVGAATNVDGYPSRDNYDNINVITPVVEIELNLTEFLKIGIGATYQIVNDVDFDAFNNYDFSAPGAVLSLKLGWFSEE